MVEGTGPWSALGPTRIGPALVALGGIVCACAAGAPHLPYEHQPSAPGAPPEVRECLGRSEVEGYLRSFHAAVIEAWELPEEASAGEKVVVRLTLGPSGELRGMRVVDMTDEPLMDSVEAAVRSAGPFGALEGRTECLDGVLLRAVFRNPRLDG